MIITYNEISSQTLNDFTMYAMQYIQRKIGEKNMDKLFQLAFSTIQTNYTLCDVIRSLLLCQSQFLWKSGKWKSHFLRLKNSTNFICRRFYKLETGDDSYILCIIISRVEKNRHGKQNFRQHHLHSQNAF